MTLCHWPFLFTSMVAYEDSSAVRALNRSCLTSFILGQFRGLPSPELTSQHFIRVWLLNGIAIASGVLR